MELEMKKGCPEQTEEVISITEIGLIPEDWSLELD